MLRLGIVGCGRAARIHLPRLLAREGVRVVALADVEPSAVRDMAAMVPDGESGPVLTFSDHKELLGKASPDALAIFAPHRHHYRLAMDALQARCHVFIEKPLSTNAQEADDIVGLARGRGRIVAVGHQYRLSPSLIEARRRIDAGAIGPIRLVTASLSAPWLARHQEKADAWRLDPKLAGGGILADAGDHLLDALLWTTGRPAAEVAAFQTRHAPGLDIVTAAALKLGDGIPATLAISGVCPGSLFELVYYGESGRLRATDSALTTASGSGPEEAVGLAGASETIDGDFVAAVARGGSPACPAEDAVATVRLLEAIARSATSGQVVRLG